MAVSVVKFGIALPWIFPKGGFKPETVTAAAQTCEESDWDSIWCGDHLLHLSGMEVPESWTLLTASATVTNKVRLGTCVTDPHRYHPAVLAQRLATIDHFSNGRVILGLGAGCSVNMDTFNIDWRNPVSKLEEYFQILKGLWGCEKFSHEGKHWSFKNAFLQIKPRQESIPIYFAANSPRTLWLTGKYADGWVPTGLTPSMYTKRLDVVREAARKAGRNPDDIDAGLYLGVGLADSAEKARAMLGLYKTLLSPGTLAEAGYKIDFPKELREYSYVGWKPTPEYMNTLVEYMKFVPDEVLSDFFVLGTADDCAEKIEEFVKAGVKHFVMDAVAEDYGTFVRDFGQVLSAVRD